jgi:hypothetical protein
MEEAKQFQLFCEEGVTRSITALSAYSTAAVCGGDAMGNVFIFEYASILFTANASLDSRIFKAPRRLTLKMNFNVGDVVTGVSYSDDIFQSLWYQTVSGQFGGILYMAGGKDTEWLTEYNRRVKLLRAVEMETSAVFAQLTFADHISFRNRQFPASNVLDLDMVEIYRGLSSDRRAGIAKKIGDCFKNNEAMKSYEGLTPAIIDFEAAKFANYFFDWQRKLPANK